MDSSVSPKDEIWSLRVYHHISNAVYPRSYFYVIPRHNYADDILLLQFLHKSDNLKHFCLLYWHINYEPNSLKLLYYLQCKLYNSWISGNSCSTEFMIDTRAILEVFQPSVRSDCLKMLSTNSQWTVLPPRGLLQNYLILVGYFRFFRNALAAISEDKWPTFSIGFLRWWRRQCKFQTIPTNQALTVFFHAIHSL